MSGLGRDSSPQDSPRNSLAQQSQQIGSNVLTDARNAELSRHPKHLPAADPIGKESRWNRFIVLIRPQINTLINGTASAIAYNSNPSRKSIPLFCP